jgi:peptide/nickel transport system permease protein
MLIVFFTSPEYGNALHWFPAGGVTDLPKTAPFMARFWDIGYHLVLPIICVTYGSLAFIARQMRGGMLNVVKQDYIRTARAKGLEEKKIIWKHAFRNSLFPIITMFAYIFPAAIAGSVVIEVIFSIPGMGGLAYSSIIARDWPVVYTILMFAAILTMVGNLVADMLYAVADPRVTFK